MKLVNIVYRTLPNIDLLYKDFREQFENPSPLFIPVDVKTLIEQVKANYSEKIPKIRKLIHGCTNNLRYSDIKLETLLEFPDSTAYKIIHKTIVPTIDTSRRIINGNQYKTENLIRGTIAYCNSGYNCEIFSNLNPEKAFLIEANDEVLPGNDLDHSCSCVNKSKTTISLRRFYFRFNFTQQIKDLTNVIEKSTLYDNYYIKLATLLNVVMISELLKSRNLEKAISQAISKISGLPTNTKINFSSANHQIVSSTDNSIAKLLRSLSKKACARLVSIGELVIPENIASSNILAKYILNLACNFILTSKTTVKTKKSFYFNLFVQNSMSDILTRMRDAEIKEYTISL